MSGDDSLIAKIRAAQEAARRDYDAVESMDQLEALRVRYLGRKGLVGKLFSGLGRVAEAERPQMGQELNTLKNQIQKLHDSGSEKLSGHEETRAPIDPTLPGRIPWLAKPHVISQTLEEMKSIFKELGFSVALGPEIELEELNFEALNFPENHPARDLQDTFYIDDKVLLRTQTSPMQVRLMRSQSPPIRVVVPGRVYRNEAIDSTHAAEFYQLEGLYVDRQVSMVDLKATLAHFVRRMFGEGTKIRFKPHYFPFTEPSVDIDMTWAGDKSGWIEVMGAGMVHPNVFKAAGYDPEEVSGFAFGMGVDRIAMLRYGITDIRLLLENDVRFLRQF